VRREKRTKKLVANVTPSLFEQFELFREQEGVISMSDYLHRILEDHAEERVRITRQRIGRRIGTQ
jgi:hypothetical protein